MNTPDTLPSECDDPDVHLGDTPRGKLLALEAFEELVKQRWEDFVNRRGEFRNEGPFEILWDEKGIEGPPLWTTQPTDPEVRERATAWTRGIDRLCPRCSGDTDPLWSVRSDAPPRM